MMYVLLKLQYVEQAVVLSVSGDAMMVILIYRQQGS